MNTMTEHNYYTCDFCNKTFKDYEECAAHERRHKLDLLNGNVRLFSVMDGQLVEKKLDANGIDSFTLLYCADKDAWDNFQDIMCAEGFGDMNESVDYGSKYYAYDEFNGEWYDLVERMDEIVTLYSNLIDEVGEKG